MSDKRSDRDGAIRGEDERVQRTKHTVLAATYKLMWEGGIGGVSIDEVARRSGVAKTSIYRHWPTRAALLLDACSRLGTTPEIPDTGTLRGDLAVLARRLAEQLRTARWPAILPSIIDAAERDEDIARMHAKLQAGFSSPYIPVVERAIARGELPARQNPAEIIAVVLGPLFFRRWFSREPLDETFVKSVVARALLTPRKR